MKHQNKSLWQLLRIIPVIVLVFCTISRVPAQTAPQIAEKALAATVYLEMQDSKGVPLGFGSGFFVGDNLIATNYHVIEGAARGTAQNWWVNSALTRSKVSQQRTRRTTSRS